MYQHGHTWSQKDLPHLLSVGQKRYNTSRAALPGRLKPVPKLRGQAFIKSMAISVNKLKAKVKISIFVVLRQFSPQIFAIMVLTLWDSHDSAHRAHGNTPLMMPNVIASASRALQSG